MDSSFLEHHLEDQLQQKDFADHFFWHKVRWNAASAVLPKQKSFQLLDIGAGTGQVGRFLKKDFPSAKYHFIEPIAALNKDLKLNFGENQDYQKNENYQGIDYITCLDVLEHIEKDKEFITDMIHKSASRTRIILTVPAIQSLWSEWDVAMGHYRRYTKSSLLALFTGLDIQIHRIHYLFPEMYFAGLIRKYLIKSNSEQGSEFPQLSSVINSLFYCLSETTRHLGAINPFGSSLLIDITKN